MPHQLRNRSGVKFIDAHRERRYSEAMAVKSIQPGQVWRNDQDGRTYLVTKLYTEVFAQYAVLRQADTDAAGAETVRLKVLRTAEGATLPGYTFTQDSQEF